MSKIIESFLTILLYTIGFSLMGLEFIVDKYVNRNVEDYND